MVTTLTCIALRTVKHSDRSSILSVYSAQRGRLSLAVPAGNGKSAARFRALTMPMGVFECVADLRPGREIVSARDVRAIILPPTASPVVSIQAIFIADLLSGLLREPQADAPLYAFLARAAWCLTGSRHSPANFHIAFMRGLQRFLGVEPDWSTFRPGYLFDMAGGVFVPLPPTHPHYLPAAEAEAAHRLSRMTFENSHMFKMSRTDRNLILDRFLTYYRLHYPSVPAPASTAILRQLFD